MKGVLSRGMPALLQPGWAGGDAASCAPPPCLSPPGAPPLSMPVLICTPATLPAPQVVNLGNGRVVGSLAGHAEDSSVEAVCFSRHIPNVAMSGGMDGNLICWDLGAAVVSTRATCSHPEVRVGRGPCCSAGACTLHAR